MRRSSVASRSLNIKRIINTANVALIISILSLGITWYYAAQVNNKSEIQLKLDARANDIAQKGVNVQVTLSANEADKKRLDESEQISEKAYEDLYTSQYFKVMADIKENKIVKNSQELLYVIDTIEGFSNKYCKQKVTDNDFTTYMYYPTNYVCNNNQISSFYGGYRKYSSILCYKYFSSSKFAQYVNKKNFEECPALKE